MSKLTALIYQHLRTRNLFEPVGLSRRAGLILLVVSFLVACNSSLPQIKPTLTPSVPPLAEELVIYNWAEDVPQSVFEAFTAEYGVRVNYLAYESQEEAIENIRSGEVFDVVSLDNRFIPALIQGHLLSEIDLAQVPNLKNISANFRGLVYDPENRYSVPYQWGTTGLVVRSDLVAQPVTRWADLWDPRYAGKIGLWRGEQREMLGLALKSLGYSANTENRSELEAALERLLALKFNAIYFEDFGLATSAGLLESEQILIAMGWSYDVLEGQQLNPAIQYVLPEEGAMLWGENFVIPANSSDKRTAELLINFLMRPEINAEIVNYNYYATANEAAFPFVEPEILNDPVIFPTNESLQNAEIVLPLSREGEKLYSEIWARFLSDQP